MSRERSNPIGVDTRIRVRPTRLFLILALLALTVATWVPRFRGPIDLRWDGATYYVLGTALAEGKGYRLLNEPGDIEAVQYPPLLPALVAAHQWVLGTSDPLVVGHWLRLVFFVLCLAFAASSYLLLERFVPAGYAFVGVVVCLLHLHSLFLSDLLSAELPFGLLTVLFGLWSVGPGARARPALAGTCAVLGYLIRSTGIVLLIVWVADRLLRGDFKRAALRAAIAVVPIAGWVAYVAAVQSSAAYGTPAYPYQRADYLFYNVTYAANLSLRDPYAPELGRATVADLAKRVVRNVLRVPRSLGEAVSADRGYWWALVVRVPGARIPVVERHLDAVTTAALIGLGALILAGIATQLARAERLLASLLLLYIGAICVTPWPLQWPRYWSPIAPLLVLALLQCLLRARDLAGPAWSVLGRGLLPGVLGTILVLELFTAVYGYQVLRGPVLLQNRQGELERFSLFFYRRADREFDQALQWLRDRARPTDVVATAMPHWAYLVTGMKTVMPPFEIDPERVQRLLDAVPVRYVIIDGTDVDIAHLMRRSTVEMIRAAPDRWKRVYSGPSGLVAIYERVAGTRS